VGGRRRHPHRPPRRRGLRRLAVIFQERPQRGTAHGPRCGAKPWSKTVEQGRGRWKTRSFPVLPARISLLLPRPAAERGEKREWREEERNEGAAGPTWSTAPSAVFPCGRRPRRVRRPGLPHGGTLPRGVVEPRRAAWGAVILASRPRVARLHQPADAGPSAWGHGCAAELGVRRLPPFSLAVAGRAGCAGPGSRTARWSPRWRRNTYPQ
jgi:hypothetical protein